MNSDESRTLEETAFQAMARTYALGGTKVFPLWWIDPATGKCACRSADRCDSPGKHPLFTPAHGRDDPLKGACKGTCGRIGHGVNDATDDVSVVTGWWGRSPLANIGMPAHANGLAILDVDPRHGGDRSLVRLRIAMTDRGSPWPSTVVQLTGSGGEHHLFRAPPDGIVSKSKSFGPDMPGLDTRGRGGYIVAAPSRHASGGVYEWAGVGYSRLPFFADPPPWPALLTELMTPTREAAKIAGVRVGSTPEAQEAMVRRLAPEGVERYVAVAVENELSALRSTSDGARNTNLNKAGYAIGRFVAAGKLPEDIAYRELCRAALAAGLEIKNIPRTAQSGLSAGMGRDFTIKRRLAGDV